MVSYEIALGMSTIPVLLLAGNVSLHAIIDQQAHMGWNVFSLTVAWFIFLVAAFAETNRCRSICRRRSPSSSPAITPSTAA
jgi:NADH-quinone oxidoreductase subunit H